MIANSVWTDIARKR